jgi:hypothetical protein
VLLRASSRYPPRVPTLRRLVITLDPGRYAVCRLAADAAIPAWSGRGAFQCVTRTASELSIVCEESAPAADIRAERGFRALAVQGPLPFELTGVIAAIATPLAAAEISLFAIATFDTDWVLVRDADLERAVAALRGAGHTVE